MSVAKAYARALFEAARDAGASSQGYDTLESEMAQFNGLLGASRDLRIALTGPVASGKEKVAIVEQLAGKAAVSALFSRFLALLARKSRIGILSEISACFSQVRVEAEGGVLGHVVSAEPLDPSDRDELARSFSKKLGKKIVFQTKVDPELLAGIKVTVGGVSYDGTLKSQLRQLRDRFIYGSEQAQ